VESIEEVVDKIKVLAWRWYLGRLAKNRCFYYKCSWDPLICLSEVENLLFQIPGAGVLRVCLVLIRLPYQFRFCLLFGHSVLLY